ncbi:MAG: hypothetical protein WA996_25200 [Candidatus Promineifilaceae bacterium]
MMQRKLVLLVLVLLLISVGIVVAQSSTNYIVQRFVVTGGGSAESANYTVTSVIGQPATDVVDSSNYRVSAGFLHPLQHDSGFDNKTWLPVILK